MSTKEVIDGYSNEHPNSKERRALQAIYDISIDYDGYTDAPNLKAFIDELRELAKEGLRKE